MPGTFDYDAMWRGAWGDLQERGPQHRHKYRLILRLLRDADFHSVLDVGCGSGALLALLEARYGTLELAGVDVSETALDLARRRLRGFFAVLDIERGHLSEHFDLVMCCDVIEHIQDDESALTHLATMSRKYLLLSTPGGRMRPSERSIGHLRNYQMSEIRAKVERRGFALTKCFSWGFPFYSPFYRDFQEWFGPKIGEGTWDWKRRVVARIIYWLYFLNSRRRGDVLMLLFQRR